MSKPERTKPRAILFDLDDTILPAFSRPDMAWTEVVGHVMALSLIHISEPTRPY